VSEAPAQPLRVEVLGPQKVADLVPSDPGIECRRATIGTRVGARWAEVLIVDLDEAGGVAAEEIGRVFDPERPVVILAVSRDPACATTALAAGAADFALLPRDRKWLRETVLRERDRRLRVTASRRAEAGEDGDRLVVDVPPEGLSFEDYERRVVEHALARSGWNRSRAARELEISRPRLLRMIERHGLE
jgi:DNA-binding NtrC family response regulator